MVHEMTPTSNILHNIYSSGRFAFAIFSIAAAVQLTACSTVSARTEPIIGDEPVIKLHVNQDDIDSGTLDIDEIVEAGELLFVASFNSLDGAGRPETADIVRDNNNTIVNMRPRQDFPNNFNRISGPDANTCLSCHNLPRAGGGGDNSTNIFALADRLTNVNFDGGMGDKSQGSAGPDAMSFADAGLERNSPGLFGSGWIELLAREMTTDLHDIVEQAINEAKESGNDVTADLVTKGVSFGRITAHRDATIDQVIDQRNIHESPGNPLGDVESAEYRQSFRPTFNQCHGVPLQREARSSLRDLPQETRYLIERILPRRGGEPVNAREPWLTAGPAYFLVPDPGI